MAVEVKAGETYTCEKPLNRDNWSMFRLKDKGSEIAVFVGENINLQDGDRVRVKAIRSTKNTARPLKDRDGNPVKDETGKQKWVPSVTANVDLEVLGREASSDFAEEFGDDGELPF